MSIETDTAERYRRRAEELRTIASGGSDHSNNEALIRIADDYERMAQSLISIDRTNKSIRRPRPE